MVSGHGQGKSVTVGMVAHHLLRDAEISRAVGDRLAAEPLDEQVYLEEGSALLASLATSFTHASPKVVSAVSDAATEGESIYNTVRQHLVPEMPDEEEGGGYLTVEGSGGGNDVEA